MRGSDPREKNPASPAMLRIVVSGKALEEPGEPEVTCSGGRGRGRLQLPEFLAHRCRGVSDLIDGGL